MTTMISTLLAPVSHPVFGDGERVSLTVDRWPASRSHPRRNVASSTPHLMIRAAIRVRQLPAVEGAEELGDPHTKSEAERDRPSVATSLLDTSPERPMCRSR